MRVIESGLKRLSAYDEAWCLRLNAASSILWICALFRVISRLGDGWIWLGLMMLLLVAESPAAHMTVTRMALAGIGGLALYKLIKHKTLRPRPYQVECRIRLGTPPLDHYSFPSGHTLHAVSFTSIAVRDFPELAVVLIPFTALVAMSRVVLGLHYPTDVVAGAAIGAALASLVVLI